MAAIKCTGACKARLREGGASETKDDIGERPSSLVVTNPRRDVVYIKRTERADFLGDKSRGKLRMDEAGHRTIDLCVESIHPARTTRVSPAFVITIYLLCSLFSLHSITYRHDVLSSQGSLLLGLFLSLSHWRQ